MNVNNFGVIIQGDKILLNIEGRSYTVSKTHLQYDAVLEALRNEDYEKVAELVDVEKSVSEYYGGLITIKNGGVYYDGRKVKNYLTKRICETYRQQLPMGAIVNFFKNLMENPSYHSVNELHEFLERNNHPFTPDGCFLAYRRVTIAQEDNETTGIKKGDFVDCWTGKINNNVGREVSVARHHVDDDRHNICSRGLHFCSMEYLVESGYGRGHNSVITVVKINPRDVVSIPVDYDNAKGRCCRYEVIRVHSEGEEDTFSTPVEVSVPLNDYS